MSVLKLYIYIYINIISWELDSNTMTYIIKFILAREYINNALDIKRLDTF